ncbi:hypothetical protein ACVNPX_11350 [Staphylococcus aureus]
MSLVNGRKKLLKQEEECAIADKIKEHREALARLETLDTGKNVRRIICRYG